MADETIDQLREQLSKEQVLAAAAERDFESVVADYNALRTRAESAERELTEAHKELNAHSPFDKEFPLVMRVRGLVLNHASLDEYCKRIEHERNEAGKVLQDESKTADLLANAYARTLNGRDKLLTACKSVLRMIQSHQIYDKDARSVLEHAIKAAKDTE